MLSVKWQKGRQPRRLLCFSAAFFVTALLFCEIFGTDLPLFQVILWTGAGAAVSSIGLALLLRKQTLTLIPILIGFLAGWLWCSGYGLLVWQPTQKYDGRWAHVRFEATDHASRTASYCAIDGVITELDGEPCRLKVRAYLDETTPDIFPGDAMRFYGEFSGVHRSFRRNLLQKGRFLTVSQHGEAEVLPIDAMTALRRIRVIAGQVRARAKELLPGDEGALLASLLSGGRSDFSPEMKRALTVSGMSHITAVSGLHISVLTGILLWLFGKKNGLLVAIPASLLYAGLAGFTPSVMRAVILLIFWSVSFWMKEERDSLTALAAALLLLILHQPFSCKSISLQLSFAAALGLMLISAPIQSVFMRRIHVISSKPLKTILRYASGVLSATIAASLFTMPITMLYFDVVPLLSLASNLLTLWTLSIIVLLGVSVLGISMISMPIAGFLAKWVLHWPLLWVISVIRGVGKLRFAATDAANFVLASAVLLALGVVLLWRWKKLSGKRLMLCMTALFCAAALLTAGQRMLMAEIRVVNCGAPLFLVRSEGFSVLGSGGDSAQRKEETERAALRWNAAEIDTAICTMPFRGEVCSEKLSIGLNRLLLPPSELMEGASPAEKTEAYNGGTFDLGGVQAQLLYSTENACALRLCGRSFSLISFCGLDGEQARLVTERYHCSADVLVLDDRLLKYRDIVLEVYRRVEPREVLLVRGRYGDEKAYFHQIPLTNVDRDGVRFRFMR